MHGYEQLKLFAELVNIRHITKEENNLWNTQHLFIYQRCMFQLLQRNAHQTVHQSLEMGITYIKSFCEWDLGLTKVCYMYRYMFV